jgi:hypothetical protein
MRPAPKRWPVFLCRGLRTNSLIVDDKFTVMGFATVSFAPGTNSATRRCCEILVSGDCERAKQAAIDLATEHGRA